MKLLVTATAAEIMAFPHAPHVAIPGWTVLNTQPGKVPAAVGLTEALVLASASNEQFSEIVVVGTAGVLDPSLGRGIYEIGSTIQHDVTDLDGVVGQHVSLPARVEIGPGPMIATGDSFVSDPTLVATIRGLGAQLVDMESYVYALVAKRFHVPIRIIKAISDDASEGAEKLWDEVVAECSEQLWDWFARDYGLDGSAA